MAEDKKTITSMMEENRKFPPPQEFSEKAHIKSLEDYRKLYKRSIEDPEGFWNEQAQNLEWFQKWDKVLDYSFKDNIYVKWFQGGKLNVTVNCLDRHLKTARKDKAAIIWEGEPGETRTFTYLQLYTEVCKFANVLKKKGVKKGDRVTIYMPMIPELAIAMLACARIGAIHSIVFGGFSADALKDRIQDSSASALITSDASFRSGKVIGLKNNADAALVNCPSIKTVIVCNRTNTKVDMKSGRDFWWHEEMAADDIKPVCQPEVMDAEDPLFILYTSGSTGKPKGVLHTTAGYLLYVMTTFKWIFDYKDEDVFWCTADIGWVTGHSYIVYGPLAAGATTLMFEGVPNYPKPDRFWEVVEKYRVNIFYTAPTALRAMMRDGDKWPLGRDLSSLRLLGSVGEPINPEAWMWYYRVIGKEKCPIVDTWWQTETGGMLITPIPGAIAIKPGSATKPFPGIAAAVIREDGSLAEVNEGGYLVIQKPWPGIMRSVYGQHERFKETYFVQFPGMYFTGDGARVDEDGDFWLMGRVDDVINVSGHRIGTAEVESALVSHSLVAEAAVVGMPHEIKGQGIYAFVTLKAGEIKSDDLKKALVAHVRKEIGPIATPDKIQFTDALPKTRSGKIMRRILKKIAAGDVRDLGDTTTLADPAVVQSLVSERQ
ncbi:MAG: acetate--CoA ligase [Thermodesulfobacteriota bacterium]|nr:acetate--CoA ligase [Thermodesulfobacteriota bacterium]